MDSDSFSGGVTRLIARGRDAGGVSLDDIEAEVGDVAPIVFEDVVAALGSAGVPVDEAAEEAEASGDSAPESPETLSRRRRIAASTVTRLLAPF